MKSIFSGFHGSCHVQGIAVDFAKKYIYYSFTTSLVKTNFEGDVLGSVSGLTGHLGCIVFNPEDGKVYGSLEYKNDAIVTGIRKKIGDTSEITNAFYMAVFDVDALTSENMDAERDSIMTAAYLREVVEDYNANGLNAKGETVAHRYGCSGIDGTAIGPMFGAAPDSKRFLFVAYGIYSDETRNDNDHQIILCYDIEELKKTARPLSQRSMHLSGPEIPLHKLFLYTGNTTYGVQNLEYDPYTNGYFLAVYPGRKKEFPNYALYLADASRAPETCTLQGLEETGEEIFLSPIGRKNPGNEIPGWNSDNGDTGLVSLGDGRFWICESFRSLSGEAGFVLPFLFKPEEGFVLDNRGF